MSLRLEMLQAARLAPKVLGESTDLVRRFLLCRRNPDGGFQDRAGRSDLYYTVFALDSLMALQADIPVEPVTQYLASFGDGLDLDFVHLCCLTRAWATLESRSSRVPPLVPTSAAGRIEAFRARDGGYAAQLGSSSGTAYGAFLALGAYQDLGMEPPDPQGLTGSLLSLQTGDGAWANEPGFAVGATNATAAAVTGLRHLGCRPSETASQWLLDRCCTNGGFLATPHAPIPDLLSTATALHALAGLRVPFEQLKEQCLDFVDSLWTNDGAFHGHWADDFLDCEYAFYGLLALGHLA